MKLVLALMLALVALPAPLGAKDQSRYTATPEMHEFFKSLRSRSKANCCDLADGRTLADPDWESKDGKYRVYFDNEWHDVPDSALVDAKNIYGAAVVWLMPDYEHPGKRRVLCFMPGAMS